MRRYLVVFVVACSRDAAMPDAANDPTIDAAIDAPAGCVMTDAAPLDPPHGAACAANGVPGECFDRARCTGSRTPVAGQCAGGTEIQCCTPAFAAGIACDPSVMTEPNQCLVEESGDPGCPAGMAKVDTFCVDRYEATLVDASGAPWSPYFRPPAGMRARSVRGAVPQGFISQLEATAACDAAGKRLCTDEEWLRACKGPTGTTYPYGATKELGRCNDHRAMHPAVELYGTTDSWIYSHLDSPCLSQLANGLARGGELAGCVSAEGAFDMMGNLHEWTADPAGTFRGGFYVDTTLNGPGCDYKTTAHAASYSDYSTGFRCCAAPVP